MDILKYTRKRIVKSTYFFLYLYTQHSIHQPNIAFNNQSNIVMKVQIVLFQLPLRMPNSTLY